MDSLQVTEDQSAAVATAPRITKTFIESQLAKVFFFTGDVGVSGATTMLASGEFVEGPRAPDDWQQDFAHHTYCVLQTHAGFSVTGHSAPASPDNFNAALGRQFAYENAFRQLWPLFAFAMLEATNRLGLDEFLEP